MAQNTDTALVRRMESFFPLTDQERRALAALPVIVRRHAAKQDIVQEGDRPTQCCLILEGVACRYKILGGGRRQIFSFHIAGDIPDLESLHLRVMDHSLAAVTPLTAGFIRHEQVRELTAHHSRLGAAFWRETLIDAAIFRQWMVGMGRKEALGRIAHLLCEMYVKSQAVGLTDGQSCPLPITQVEFADALGLTPVHVNRVLQDLRRMGLVVLTRSTLTVLDWEGLVRASEFEPLYLHQEPREVT